MCNRPSFLWITSCSFFSSTFSLFSTAWSSNNFGFWLSSGFNSSFDCNSCLFGSFILGKKAEDLFIRKDSNRKLSPDYQAKKKQVAVDNTDKNNDRRQQIADALQTASDSLYGKMESGGAFGSTGPSGIGAGSIDDKAQLGDYEIKSFNPTQTTRLRKDEY